MSQSTIPATQGDGAEVRARARRATMWIWVSRVVLILAILGVWQWVGSRSSNLAFFISTPSAVVVSLVDALGTTEFWLDVGVTLEETVVGFLIGAVAGVVVGFALAFIPAVHRVVSPLINAFNSLPRIALASLFILWFGLGMESKIALIVSLVFFPLFFNAYQGATTIDPDYRLMMRTFGASRWALVTKVVLPSTVPWLGAGTKQGLAQALGGAVIAEIVSAQLGLGAALNTASTTFDTAREFALLIVLVLIAIILNGVNDVVERRASRWR